VLDDPERYLSTTHCGLSLENGQFYIADLSTNGTFLNGSTNAMGKGTKLPLNDGDSFTLGDYEFAVSLNQSASDNNVQDSGPFDGGFPESAPQAGNGSTPFAEFVPGRGPVSGEDHSADPVADYNGDWQAPPASGGQIIPEDGDDWDWASPSIDAQRGDDPLNDVFQPPESLPDDTPFVGAGGGIPENWDVMMTDSPSEPESYPVDSPVSVPPTRDASDNDWPASTTPMYPGRLEKHEPENTYTAAQYQALADSNVQLQAELDLLKSRQMEQRSTGSLPAAAVDIGLLEAMGFQTHELTDEEISRVNLQVGEVVREMIIGLMKVLGSRSTIKNEFRMNITTIQPVENNPLKFSANISDALENMFIKQGNAYKKPLEAVREGFDGIAEHQVAILAGMRAAFRGVVERFDPKVLDARFSRQQKSSIFPVNQDARNWESYLEYYKDLAGDSDNSFQSLFGDEFVNAYEEQLQKLSFARKANN